MGRSLHSKIYLGRRYLTLNVDRIWLVASMAIASGVFGMVLNVIKDGF